MVGSRSVAGLAGDIDLGKSGFEPILSQVVRFAQVGGVTLGALMVPVLKRSCPMENIAVVDRLPGIEVEPALTSLHSGSGIPGNAQCLVASSGKLDQVLLQRLHPEGVRNWIIV